MQEIKLQRYGRTVRIPDALAEAGADEGSRLGSHQRDAQHHLHRDRGTSVVSGDISPGAIPAVQYVTLQRFTDPLQGGRGRRGACGGKRR